MNAVNDARIAGCLTPALGLAAVMTLGLSELVTTPLEGALGQGAEIQLRVLYDEQDRVQEVEVLEDDRWLPVQTIGGEG